MEILLICVYSMEPSHYEEVPKSVLDTIVAQRTKKDNYYVKLKASR